MNKMACEEDPQHKEVKTSFSVFKAKTNFVGYLANIYLANCPNCNSTIGFEVSDSDDSLFAGK